MKVLGCKVPNEVYERFKALGPSISESLRHAISLYLQHHNTNPNSEVNHIEPKVNRKNTEREPQTSTHSQNR